VAVSPQRVLAVVVVHNGRPFLRDTFRGLAEQTRPIDDVLIVDTGSTDGSADWARARLGPDAILAVRGQLGRAVSAALRDPRSAEMDWLWLLHDDSAPEAEALERLLSEAEARPGASILGPKLVGWNDPNRLQEVGWKVDRTGRAVSPIEDDEIDQGQHDMVQDVFYVSTAGMLVRRETLLAVGGFDERISAFRDDLDLCWRTHLAGERVLIVPPARVRHFGAAASRARRTRAVSLPRYLIERHTTLALLKSTSLRRLPLVMTLALVGGLIRALGLTLTGRPGDAAQVLWAWGWNAKELPITLVHRRRAQRSRRLDDARLSAFQAPGGQRVRALLRDLLDLVYGEVGEHVAEVRFKEEEDSPALGASIGRVVARHPVGFAVAAFAALMVVSLRSLLVAPAISGGAMAPFPASGLDLLNEYRASLHGGGLGSTLAASPSLALLGAASLLTAGKALVTQKLLLWLALPLAAAACTRALRVVVPERAPRAVAGLLYATTPLAIGALAQGRLGELAFLVTAPLALAQVVLAFRADQPREPWRPALRFTLLAAVAIAMYPPALLILGLVVFGAIGVAVLRAKGAASASVVRQAVYLGAGFAAVLALLAPWSGLLFTGASPLRAIGRPLVSPSMVDLLQLRPGGPGLPTTVVGPVYPLLALAALLLVPAARRVQAFTLVLGFVVAAALAAWQAKGLPPVITDWAGGILVAGAVTWAGAAALALAGIGAVRFKLDLDPRRLAATTLALVAVASSAVVFAHLASGSLGELQPVRGRALPATVTGSQAWVLWLAGRPDHGLDFAVTGPGGRTLLDSGRPAPVPAAEALGSVVTDIAQARTHRAGAMLRMFNIGYVVVRPGPDADRLTGLVARQQDLVWRPSSQAGLYEGPDVSPGGWLLPGNPPQQVQDLVVAETPIALRGTGLGNGTGQVEGPGTVLVPMPAGRTWAAWVGDTQLEPTSALGWEQAFVLPRGVSGVLQIRETGQNRRNTLLLVEGLLVLAAFATLFRPTRTAPPSAPITLDDTVTDMPVVELTRQGVAR
jgi:GT2 family glycosyltransferase